MQVSQNSEVDFSHWRPYLGVIKRCESNESRMQYRRGVVSIWSMFVFLTMLTLYPDGRITGFALDTKTSGAAKVY